MIDSSVAQQERKAVLLPFLTKLLSKDLGGGELKGIWNHVVPDHHFRHDRDVRRLLTTIRRISSRWSAMRGSATRSLKLCSVDDRQDVDQRVGEHQAGLHDGYTAARRPVKLRWAGHFSHITDAISLEQQIKRWSRASSLINGEPDQLKALSAGARGRSAKLRQPRPPWFEARPLASHLTMRRMSRWLRRRPTPPARSSRSAKWSVRRQLS